MTKECLSFIRALMVPAMRRLHQAPGLRVAGLGRPGGLHQSGWRKADGLPLTPLGPAHPNEVRAAVPGGQALGDDLRRVPIRLLPLPWPSRLHLPRYLD